MSGGGRKCSVIENSAQRTNSSPGLRIVSEIGSGRGVRKKDYLYTLIIHQICCINYYIRLIMPVVSLALGAALCKQLLDVLCWFCLS